MGSPGWHKAAPQRQHGDCNGWQNVLATYFEYLEVVQTHAVCGHSKRGVSAADWQTRRPLLGYCHGAQYTHTQRSHAQDTRLPERCVPLKSIAGTEVAKLVIAVVHATPCRVVAFSVA